MKFSFKRLKPPSIVLSVALALLSSASQGQDRGSFLTTSGSWTIYKYGEPPVPMSCYAEASYDTGATVRYWLYGIRPEDVGIMVSNSSWGALPALGDVKVRVSLDRREFEASATAMVFDRKPSIRLFVPKDYIASPAAVDEGTISVSYNGHDLITTRLISFAAYRALTSCFSASKDPFAK